MTDTLMVKEHSLDEFWKSTGHDLKVSASVPVTSDHALSPTTMVEITFSSHFLENKTKELKSKL